MWKIGRYTYISRLYKTNSWFLYPVYFILACLLCRASIRWFSTDPLFTRIRKTVVEVVANIETSFSYTSLMYRHPENFVFSKDSLYDEHPYILENFISICVLMNDRFYVFLFLISETIFKFKREYRINY